jgi:hypothetical protein
VGRHVAGLSGSRLVRRVALWAVAVLVLAWFVPAWAGGIAEHRACGAAGGTVGADGKCVVKVEGGKGNPN